MAWWERLLRAPGKALDRVGEALTGLGDELISRNLPPAERTERRESRRVRREVRKSPRGQEIQREQREAARKAKAKAKPAAAPELPPRRQPVKRRAARRQPQPAPPRPAPRAPRTPRQGFELLKGNAAMVQPEYERAVYGSIDQANAAWLILLDAGLDVYMMALVYRAGRAVPYVLYVGPS